LFVFILESVNSNKIPDTNLDGAVNNQTQPQQVHLAFAGNSDVNSPTASMTVTWFTYVLTATSTVRYGLESGNYNMTIEGTYTTYYESVIHNVILFGLEFSTKYYYVCGDSAGGWSDEFYFTSQPSYNTQPSFKIAVYGDMGISNSYDTRQSLGMINDDIDFHYHLGDYGYADDRPQNEFETIWNEFQSEIQNLTAYKAYMTLPGNHEADCHSSGSFDCKHDIKNFTAYQHRFRMPSIESNSGSGNMWYSFNYSSAHFVAISTETDFPDAPEGRGTLWNAGPFGDQLKWLEADLQQADANRQNQPWLIVVGHRPLYSTIDPLHDFPPEIIHHTRKAFEHLFHKYNVDLYLSGHVHAYERMYPVYDSKVEQKNYDNPQDTVYLVAGNAGNIEGHMTSFKKPDDYLAYRNDTNYGYAILEIFNSSYLSWTMYAATDQSPFDTFQLSKKR